MSSPLKLFEVNSSFNGSREVDLDNSSRFTSYEVNGSFTERRKYDLVIDRAVTGLNRCLQLYEEKAHNCENHLENLGVTVKDFPQDLQSDLKETFRDEDGVFDFPHASSEMVRINVDLVLGSLQQTYELGQLRLLSSQMATLVEEYSCLQNNLEGRLNTAKEESEKLENKRFCKEADVMIFNEKLEAATCELKNLQNLSQGNHKPKYSLDELEDLKQEANKLKTDIAFTNTKLNKYNKLPLSEKEAQKQIVKMKEDLKNMENEIGKIVCSFK